MNFERKVMVLAESLLGMVGYQLRKVDVAVRFPCLLEFRVVVLVARSYVGLPSLGSHMVLVAF